MYEKLAEKFQTELHKTTSTLTQEMTALGSRTDLLETKHEELALAHADLCKDYESLVENFTFMQSQVEYLDNRDHRNNFDCEASLRQSFIYCQVISYPSS